MLDINFIRENIDQVKKAVKDKGLTCDVDKLIQIDNSRRDLIQKVDDLRRERNVAAKERDIEKGKKVKEELDKLENQLRSIEQEFNSLMLSVPNIPSTDSPVGLDSDSNVEISKWGEIPEFQFKTKDHIELGKLLGIIDLEQGVKVSGFRGYYLLNEGAMLQRAVLNFAFDKILAAGFKPIIPPTLVHEKALIGSGHFPFGKENIYQIGNPGKDESGAEIKNPLYLTGTSEPSLLAYFMDKVLDEKDLPIKICAQTQCYRSEIGDYGKDTRGLYRVHEFSKVEQVIICRNDLAESEEYFKQIQKISEEILQELEIPYHVIATSTGDMGAGKYRMNDIEAWMPSREKYGETHSNSNLTDWQARRLNLKFKSKDGGTFFCYTLNNTVIALPRFLIAFLENHQQADGSVKIPEILQKFTGFSEIRSK